MRRIQIVMSEDLDDALERRARKERTSKSELIRRIVGRELRPLPPLEEDPLWKLVGASALPLAPLEPPNPVDQVVYIDEVMSELRGGEPTKARRSARPRRKPR